MAVAVVAVEAVEAVEAVAVVVKRYEQRDGEEENEPSVNASAFAWFVRFFHP